MKLYKRIDFKSGYDLYEYETEVEDKFHLTPLILSSRLPQVLTIVRWLIFAFDYNLYRDILCSFSIYTFEKKSIIIQLIIWKFSFSIDLNKNYFKRR